MKSSLILTVIVFAAFAWFHWTKSTEVTALQEEKHALNVAASLAGLDPAAAARGETVRIAKPAGPSPEDRPGGADQAEDRERKIREFVGELAEFAVAMDQARKGGEEPDADTRKRMMEILNGFLELEEEDIPVFVRELKKKNLPAGMQGEMIGGSMMMIAQKNPASALRLLDEGGDLVGDLRHLDQVRMMCVSSLAAQDPQKALAWLDRQQAEAPETITSDLRRTAAVAMAAKDPAAAWTLAESSEDVPNMATVIGMAAKSDEARRAGLDAMRAYIQENPDNAEEISRRYFSGLGGGLAQAEFADASRWLDEAGLDQATTEQVLDGLLPNAARSHPEEWIDWMQEKLPADKVAERIEGMIPSWTREDFNGVGNWLNDQPEGDVRDRATRSFAETLAPYEPAAAAEWAGTLPESPDRTMLLQQIHNYWKDKDPEAAAAFAEERGISQ